MTLLRVNGSAIGMRISSAYFADDFERGEPDVVSELGNGWVDFADAHPADYDPMGILNGEIVTRGLTRAAAAGEPYSPNPGSDYDNFNDHPGTVIPGICGAYVDMGTPDVYVEVTWLGHISLPFHTEATPAICVVPGTAETAAGIWPGEFGVTPTFGAGSVGNPPELFSTFIQDGAFFTHSDGTPRTIGALTSNGGTEVRYFLDRRQVPLFGVGMGALPLPVNLHGSTLHGMLHDQHMCYPPGDPVNLSFMQATPSISSIKIFTR